MRIIKLDEKAFRLKVSQYLREFHNFSGRSLRNIEIYLDEKKIKSTTKLPKEGILKIIEKDKGTNIVPIPLNLDIIFEDDSFLILNKPPFLLTHPTLKKVDVTLANGIVHYFLEKYGRDIVPRFISRLDMNTSGIITIAKSAYVQSFLQLSAPLVNKKYIAIVEGIIDFDELIVEAPIYYDGINIERYVDKKGQDAKTVFRKIKTYPHLGISTVSCELFSGRTHQIRVHLKHIGFPVVGDSLYNKESKYSKIAKRQMLHSTYYSFMHPYTKEYIKIECEMYKDMKELLNEK